MSGETLTNEGLSGICSSNFELAHYAIGLARHYIKSGREATLKEILRDVKKHPNPNYLNDLLEMEHFDEDEKA